LLQIPLLGPELRALLVYAEVEPAHAELAELLESDTYVDMDKLLSLCRHGVPEHLLPEAWKYLLGVSQPERSEEMTEGKRMEQE
jgi:hypothetical protein